MPRMLRSLCLMLVVLLALPAVQARACGPEMAHGGMQMAASTDGAGHHDGYGQHQAPAQQPDQPRHECVGCIAPINIAAYRAVERMSFLLDRNGRSIDTPFPASIGSPPEPPPPRLLI